MTPILVELDETDRAPHISGGVPPQRLLVKKVVPPLAWGAIQTQIGDRTGGKA
jgi:hypothetical protein